ncbi:hypothetical protein [Enterococcus faecalis]|uniref:hypothetical protein n=1 Tax=Enterococcus faecalis TaxID=1351 RepID=UPI0021570C60|nr:hypothetical protein [Enterococcus faecalis]
MDWWNLWVPFVGTILGIIVNVCINRSQTKKNHELQKEITQKQIDANLKAKARIMWIDEVRKLSSKIISTLIQVKYMEEGYEDKLKEISKDAVLLKLYFGSYGSGKVEHINLDILLDEKTNDQKNVHISMFIDQLLEIYGSKGRNKIKRLKRIQNNLAKQKKKLWNEIEEISEWKPVGIDNEEDVITDQVPNEGKEDIYSFLHEKWLSKYGEEQKVQKEVDSYYSQAEQFEEIISLYLKIEWDKAKKGE